MFNATGFFVIDSAVAALYSVDKVSGVAIDMGHGGLTITPVDSGRVHTPGRERLPMGGQVCVRGVMDSMSVGQTCRRSPDVWDVADSMCVAQAW